MGGTLAAQWRASSKRLRNSFVQPFLSGKVVSGKVVSGNDSPITQSTGVAQVRVLFAMRCLASGFANLTDVLSEVEARCLPRSAGENAEPRSRADR